MSHPQPPQRQPSTDETQRYARTLHNVALLALFACPALALVPPRKLDFYTVGLVATTAYSGNYLLREQTGRTIWQHVRPDPRSPLEQDATAAIPATEQANLSKELQYARHEMQRLKPESGGESGPVTSQLQASQSQREAWKVQREKEIQDDVDVGKGFGEMITDQIWEVWNWGRKSDDEDEG
ncbi:hypothetical protein B0A50_07137 [Salinomyces thailandicus]|uniref:Uncharacterized protein n=1 Tax=Salinomyces thailandicus TaxID=706561 RepID=A0A4U0TNI1_9PEZI|nr:hypothetical protein B0A50_07137 [Salinomyces thailandica]